MSPRQGRLLSLFSGTKSSFGFFADRSQGEYESRIGVSGDVDRLLVGEEESRRRHCGTL